MPNGHEEKWKLILVTRFSPPLRFAIWIRNALFSAKGMSEEEEEEEENDPSASERLRILFAKEWKGKSLAAVYSESVVKVLYNCAQNLVAKGGWMG